MEITLVGRLFGYDRFERLRFGWLDEFRRAVHHVRGTTTIRQLQNYCNGREMPYDHKGFKVSKLVRHTVLGVDDLIGSICVVKVELHRYRFISRLPQFAGQLITGTCLMLVDIHKSDIQ